MLQVIKREGLSREEYALASFLQGSVNKKHGKSILIDVDIYLEYAKEPYEYVELWALLKKYISEPMTQQERACKTMNGLKQK